MEFKGEANEYIRLGELNASNRSVLMEPLESGLTLLWMKDEHTILTIDGIARSFKPNQIVCLTEFHRISVAQLSTARMVRFNRPFFCVIDHDSEVGCKGILFFGASKLPVLDIPEAELEKFDILWRMFSIEMQSRDALQIEMLQMMLKRLLILCTRLYKEQNAFNTVPNSSFDLVREYNYLVELHFKTKHTVAEYAGLLHKSPKTISNLFSQLGAKTPLQLIQERKMLEARRLLQHSDLSVKEIAYEIGYEDLQTFSRFFKAQEGISPTEFRSGRIANFAGKAA